ncbi:hypothetical protein NDU88_004745 [Pleurodeles waltl]|uniref:Uncharacterized protein n=1 Tax=Pleurodeles waltl TaxID=8319 RepID=A0AAV7T903_PLEWA|nr:hypothetical protein NDU88_004745 [Pleurodeles waltl]
MPRVVGPTRRPGHKDIRLPGALASGAGGRSPGRGLPPQYPNRAPEHKLAGEASLGPVDSYPQAPRGEYESSVDGCEGSMCERESSVDGCEGSMCERESSVDGCEGSMCERESSMDGCEGSMCERESGVDAFEGKVYECEGKAGIRERLRTFGCAERSAFLVMWDMEEYECRVDTSHGIRACGRL